MVVAVVVIVVVADVACAKKGIWSGLRISGGRGF
jgi:hypothetical protein